MMSFSLYIFGATYMIRGKLEPVIGSMHGEPFGCTAHVDCLKISRKMTKNHEV